jgi:hypothetical protein
VVAVASPQMITARQKRQRFWNKLAAIQGADIAVDQREALKSIINHGRTKCFFCGRFHSINFH